MKLSELLSLYLTGKSQDVIRSLEDDKQAYLHGLKGSSYALQIASVYEQIKGFHLLVLPGKESAAYLYNDLENLLEDVGVENHRKKVMFYHLPIKDPMKLIIPIVPTFCHELRLYLESTPAPKT